MPIVAVDLDGLEPLIHPALMKVITKPQLGTTNQGLRFEVYKAKDNLDDTYQIARIRNPHQNATAFGRVFRGTDYYFYFDPNKINADKAFGLDNTHWHFWQTNHDLSKQAKDISSAADGIGLGFAGIVAAGAAAPAASAALPYVGQGLSIAGRAILRTGKFLLGNASIGERALSFTADATAQRITNGSWGKVNWLSSLSDATFKNPAVSALAGSYFSFTLEDKFNVASMNSSSDVLKFSLNAGFSTLGNFVGGLNGKILSGEIINGKVTSQVGKTVGEMAGDVFGNVTGNAAQNEVKDENNKR